MGLGSLGRRPLLVEDSSRAVLEQVALLQQSLVTQICSVFLRGPRNSSNNSKIRRIRLHKRPVTLLHKHHFRNTIVQGRVPQDTEKGLGGRDRVGGMYRRVGTLLVRSRVKVGMGVLQTGEEGLGMLLGAPNSRVLRIRIVVSRMGADISDTVRVRARGVTRSKPPNPNKATSKATTACSLQGAEYLHLNQIKLPSKM